MQHALTAEEREALGDLVEDGFPIEIYAHGDGIARARFASLARRLVERGLLGVYGSPDNARDLPTDEAVAILSDPERWDYSGLMIATTPAGEAALRGHS